MCYRDPQGYTVGDGWSTPNFHSWHSWSGSCGTSIPSVCSSDLGRISPGVKGAQRGTRSPGGHTVNCSFQRSPKWNQDLVQWENSSEWLNPNWNVNLLGNRPFSNLTRLYGEWPIYRWFTIYSYQIVWCSLVFRSYIKLPEGFLQPLFSSWPKISRTSSNTWPRGYPWNTLVGPVCKICVKSVNRVH